MTDAKPADRHPRLTVFARKRLLETIDAEEAVGDPKVAETLKLLLQWHDEKVSRIDAEITRLREQVDQLIDENARIRVGNVDYWNRQQAIAEALGVQWSGTAETMAATVSARLAAERRAGIEAAARAVRCLKNPECDPIWNDAIDHAADVLSDNAAAIRALADKPTGREPT